jgi:hypothetical protein
MINKTIDLSIIPDCCGINTLGKQPVTAGKIDAKSQLKRKGAKEKQKRKRTTDRALLLLIPNTQCETQTNMFKIYEQLHI